MSAVQEPGRCNPLQGCFILGKQALQHTIHSTPYTFQEGHRGKDSHLSLKYCASFDLEHFIWQSSLTEAGN